jgi:GNAT superfamily N-acetyltransferase
MTFEHPGKEQIPQLLKLWKEVFGKYDGFWELFLDTAFMPDHCRCIVENGQPTAGLYWFDCSCNSEKIAYVYAVVTDPRHRGKGLCRKLMEEVHTLLQARGYDSVMLVPADEDLRKMYRKMGYEDCTRISRLSCSAGKTPVQIRNVGTDEYAALRHQLLPEGGVLQEGVQLAFLAAQAQLFAGADFLLAAYLDGQKLHGMELLGNSAAAPGTSSRRRHSSSRVARRT